MIRLKVLAYMIYTTGISNAVLGVVETHESLWLAIVSIIMGLLTILLGLIASSYLNHIQTHPGVSEQTCVVRHDGLDKVMKLNTLYLKALIEHSGLKYKVEEGEREIVNGHSD